MHSALNYGNEAEVGQGIKESGVPREEIWVTTKLDNHWHHRVQEGIDSSLKSLGLDYVDLYLVHWPSSTDPDDRMKHLPDWDFIKTWYVSIIISRGDGRDINNSKGRRCRSFLPPVRSRTLVSLTLVSRTWRNF
jgi:glycerol 2-dehydrogenase (NADP+)